MPIVPSTALQPAKLVALLGASVALALPLTGCQSVSTSPQYTLVRFLDAAPDLPAPGNLDVYQNSAATLYNMGFGSASTYIPVAPGATTYAANLANTRQQLAFVTGTLLPGAQYTVLVGSPAASLQMTLLKDQAQPAPPSQAAFRFLHQATRAAAVDIYLLPAGTRLAETAPAYANIAFGAASPYLNLPAGTYSIVVLPNGTVPGSAPALLTGTQVEYAPGAARTLVLIDQPASSPAGLQLITASDYDLPAA